MALVIRAVVQVWSWPDVLRELSLSGPAEADRLLATGLKVMLQRMGGPNIDSMWPRFAQE